MSKYLIAISSPSGGGKTTLCRMLTKKYKEIISSVSFTSRLPRTKEINGVDYFFVSEEKFTELINKDELIEWAKVHNSYYGTSKVFLEENISNEKIVLLDIDVQGVDKLKSIFKEKVLSIFILPPSMDEIESRLRFRNSDSEENIVLRLKNAKDEISKSKYFDYNIINKNLDDTFLELCNIIEKEFNV